MLECRLELRITESFPLQIRKWRLRSLPYILRTEGRSSDWQAEGSLQNDVRHLVGRSPSGAQAACRPQEAVRPLHFIRELT